MEHFEHDKTNRFFSNFALWCYDHRWTVLVLTLLLLGGSLLLAGTARVDNSFEAYFNDDDATYLAFKQFREDFGSDEVALLVYELPDSPHGVFDRDLMIKIDKLTHAIEKEVPFVDEVTSLTNIEFVEGVTDGLNITTPLESIPDSQEDMLQIRDKFLAKKLYVGGLISPDGRYASIVADMTVSGVDHLESLKLDPNGGDSSDNLYPMASYNKISEIIQRPEYAGITFYHSGDVALNNATNTIIMPEMGRISLYGAAAVSILLFLLFGYRAVGVYGPMLVVLFSIVMAAGFVGLMGWRLDMMFGLIPILMIAVGTATAVHIISEFYHQLPGQSRREAMRRTLLIVAMPCLMTTLTTMAGFGANTTSAIRTLSNLGWYTPVAVAASFVLSMTLLMFILSFGKSGENMPPSDLHSTKPHGWIATLMDAIARFVVRYPKHIVIFFILISLVSLDGVRRIRADSNFLEDFSDQVQVKQETLKIDQVLSGTGSLVYLFDTGKQDGIKNPDVLREIERVQAELDKHTDIVRKTMSIVDYIKDINKSFHADDTTFNVIPDNQDMIAQLLLVYEISGGKEISEYVSSDYSRARLEVNVRQTETSEYARLENALQVYLKTEPLQHSQIMLNGVGSLWLKLMDYIVSSQIRGLLLAFFVVTLMMCWTFSSIRLGLLSMLPNIAPVFFTLGIMGWYDITLDFGRLMLAGVGIGIAVDDTIHFISRYRSEFALHRDYKKTVAVTLRSVGKPMLITSIVLISGFLMFSFSVMDSQIIFGRLLAMIVFVALIADYLMMPAMLILTKPFGPEGKPSD
jgi:predicted RND superfamily exporter protein